MTDNLNSDPISPAEAERQFVDALRSAAFIFKTEKHGRFRGSILACRAVAQFIYQRNGGAELAGPFLQIAEAFKELEKGGKPRLFAKKTEPEKERERSPERKHAQMLAAAALEVLVKLGEERSVAAHKIARHVNQWSHMRVQKIGGQTVIAWRNQQRRLTEERRKPFDTVTRKILKTPDPSKTVVDLLLKGPPGLWQE